MTRGIQMKLVLVLIAVFVIAACGGAAPVKGTTAPTREEVIKQRVQKKCKKSFGICQYRVLPDVAASRAGKLSLACAVTVPTAAPTLAKIELGFQVSGKMVRFRECHDLLLTADGKPLPARDTTYHSALGKGFVVEAVTVPLTADELNALTTSAKIQYTLCKTSGVMTDLDLDLLRAMFLLWKAQ